MIGPKAILLVLRRWDAGGDLEEVVKNFLLVQTREGDTGLGGALEPLARAEKGGLDQVLDSGRPLELGNHGVDLVLTRLEDSKLVDDSLVDLLLPQPSLRKDRCGRTGRESE